MLMLPCRIEATTVLLLDEVVTGRVHAPGHVLVHQDLDHVLQGHALALFPQEDVQSEYS